MRPLARPEPSLRLRRLCGTYSQSDANTSLDRIWLTVTRAARRDGRAYAVVSTGALAACPGSRPNFMQPGRAAALWVPAPASGTSAFVSSCRNIAPCDSE